MRAAEWLIHLWTLLNDTSLYIQIIKVSNVIYRVIFNASLIRTIFLCNFESLDIFDASVQAQFPVRVMSVIACLSSSITDQSGLSLFPTYWQTQCKDSTTLKMVYLWRKAFKT